MCEREGKGNRMRAQGHSKVFALRGDLPAGMWLRAFSSRGPIQYILFLPFSLSLPEKILYTD